MLISTSCPSCGKTGKVPEPYQGKTVRCKQCCASFTVRSQEAAAPIDFWQEDMPPILVDMPWEQ
jgi:transcription elongation factor Elf1